MPPPPPISPKAFCQVVLEEVCHKQELCCTVSSEKENLKLEEPLGKADLIGRPETWPGQLASHAIPKAHELWLHSHPTGISSENTGHLPANQGTDLLFLPHRPLHLTPQRNSCTWTNLQGYVDENPPWLPLLTKAKDKSNPGFLAFGPLPHVLAPSSLNFIIQPAQQGPLQDRKETFSHTSRCIYASSFCTWELLGGPLIEVWLSLTLPWFMGVMKSQPQVAWLQVRLLSHSEPCYSCNLSHAVSCLGSYLQSNECVLSWRQILSMPIQLNL